MLVNRKANSIILQPLGATDRFPGLQGLSPSCAFGFGVSVVSAVLKHFGHLVMDRHKTLHSNGFSGQDWGRFHVLRKDLK